MSNKTKKLTTKQQRFVDFYDGNATDAARKAGYKGNGATLKQVGSENLAKHYIKKALKERESKKKILTLPQGKKGSGFGLVYSTVRKKLKSSLGVVKIEPLLKLRLQ